MSHESHVFCHVSCWILFERASHQAKHFFFSVFLCAKGKAFAQGQGKVASCGIPWLPDSTWCEWVKGQTHAKNCKNKRNNIIQYCDIIVPCRMSTCSFMFLLFVREMYPWHIFISIPLTSLKSPLISFTIFTFFESSNFGLSEPGPAASGAPIATSKGTCGSEVGISVRILGRLGRLGRRTTALDILPRHVA